MLRTAAHVALQSLTTSLAIAFATLALAADAPHASPWDGYAIGSPVAVALPGGRIVRGAIAPHTDHANLWLVAEVEGMQIGSCLAAADVVSIAPAESLVLPPRETAVLPEAQKPSPAQQGPNRVVKSLAIMAQLENWDGDAEPDGLRLFIIPRGADGAMLPVSGTLSADLTVYRGNWVHSFGRYSREEEWSSDLSSAAFGPYGAVVELPFRRISPETDRDLHFEGRVHVRLNVPGVGSFDAVVDHVLLTTRPVHPAK